jgi:hypothetical protein
MIASIWVRGRKAKSKNEKEAILILWRIGRAVARPFWSAENQHDLWPANAGGALFGADLPPRPFHMVVAFAWPWWLLSAKFLDDRSSPFCYFWSHRANTKTRNYETVCGRFGLVESIVLHSSGPSQQK